MSQQVRKPKPNVTQSTSPQVTETADVTQSQSRAQEQGEHLKSEMDTLLDEIDDVLTENAQEMVENYVQLGGQ